MKTMKGGIPNIMKQGTRQYSGIRQVIMKNIDACQALAKITTSSYGPNGMNKMVINRHGKLFVTSDAATIMTELEIEHPAAKIILLACEMQQFEYGDATNFVVVFAGELLKLAGQLIEMGLHPTDIIRGYQIAGDEAVKILSEMKAVKEFDVSLHNEDSLKEAIVTAIGAKQFSFKDMLTNLVAKACTIVMPDNPIYFQGNMVRVCKLPGGILSDSFVIPGMVLTSGTEGAIRYLKGAHVVIYNESVDALDTETKGTVRLNSAQELMDYNQSEEVWMENMIRNIHETGANCIISGGKFGEMALHFIDKFGLMAIKVPSKEDLRRISILLRAPMLVKFGPVRKDDLGYADSISAQEIGGSKVTVIDRAQEDARLATIVLRASTQNILDDLERACADGVNVVKSMAKDSTFVHGGGACEVQLARQIEIMGGKCTGLEQYSVRKYGEAFEVFPRTLAENTGLKANDTVATLYALHENGSIDSGINIEKSEVSGMAECGVMDLRIAKLNAIKLATNAAITVLKVDQLIMAKPAGGPRMPQKQGHWDDDDE